MQEHLDTRGVDIQMAPESGSACRDLSTIGDTVLIGVTKDGVRFSTQGDIGSANVTLRCIPSLDD